VKAELFEGDEADFLAVKAEMLEAAGLEGQRQGMAAPVSPPRAAHKCVYICRRCVSLAVKHSQSC
jgi:hypothetical protein